MSEIMKSPEIEPKIENLMLKIEKNPRLSFVFDFEKVFPKGELYLVGGAVRDALMGEEPKDFDFLVRLVPKEELEKFLEERGKIKEVESRAFGNYKFIPFLEGGRAPEARAKRGPALPGGVERETGVPFEKEEPIDINLPRTEEWTGLGYKDLKVETAHSLPIEKDLERRDFTINSMALNLKTKKLLDPHNGVGDIERKVIRCVGEAEERYKEDPSRMLRAVRFACQFDFEIEEKTERAIKENAKEIKRIYEKEGKEKTRVAEEVIGKEFLKSFKKEPLKTLTLYEQTGLLALLLPEVSKMKGVPQPFQFHSEGDVFEHSLLTLKELPKDASIECKLAGLFHDIGKPETITFPKYRGDRIRFNEHDNKGAEITEKIIYRLKIFDCDFKEIPWLVKNHMIPVSGNVDKMKLTTLERYFFENEKWGKDLLALAKADIEATVPPSKKPDFGAYDFLIKRLKEVKENLKVKEKLPKELLDGYEIMKILGLKPGPKVGQIKEALREAQLSGKIKTKEEARKFLRCLN